MNRTTMPSDRATRRRRPLSSLPWIPDPAREASEAQPPFEAINEVAPGGAEVEARDRRYRRSLALADALATALALALVVTLSGEGRLRATSLLALPLVVAVAKLQGLYDRDELLIHKTTLDEVPRLFGLATLCTLGFWLMSRWLVAGRLDEVAVLGVWLALSVFLVLGRWGARVLAQRVVAPERCVFVGDADGYERLRARLEHGPGIKAVVLGRMSVRSLDDGDDRDQRLRHERDLRELIAAVGAHRLVIDPQLLPAAEMLDFVRAAKGAGVRVSLLPRVLDVVGSSVVFDELQGMTVLGVRRFGLTRSSRLVKRAFDLVGAGLVLLVLTPLMALIALLVKLDSPGPVLFRQIRIGRDGHAFQIAKFRTMVADAEGRKAELRERNEAEGLFKIADDPRITRVGRLLRRTSLDELPQLLNVVRGDMSLVGPRPLVVDEDAQITGWDRRRLQLTPGMTGQWQIAGSSRVPLHEMVKIDYVYVAGWSLWSDVKILLRTVPYVLHRRGL